MPSPARAGALRLRCAQLILALVALLACAPPASAGSTGRHLLELYKAERHVDVDPGARLDAEVSCHDRSDTAVDGMWRVDHVDPDASGVQRFDALQVHAAEPNAADLSEYRFTFVNAGAGRAQVKLFVTCLGREVEEDRRHVWWVDSVAGSSFEQSRGPGRHLLSPAPRQCDRGELAISPGFRWLSGYGDLFKSGSATAGLRGWEWGFFVSALNGQAGEARVRVTHRCLQRRSAPGHRGHSHRIRVRFRPQFPPPPTSIAAGALQTRTRTCAFQEKAMLHWLDVDPLGLGARFLFMGMDSRIRSRAYKVWNRDPLQANDVRLGAICFHDRTTRR